MSVCWFSLLNSQLLKHAVLIITVLPVSSRKWLASSKGSVCNKQTKQIFPVPKGWRHDFQKQKRALIHGAGAVDSSPATV